MINLLWNTSKKMIAGRSFPTKTSTERCATVWRHRPRVLPALFEQPHPFRERNGRIACAAPQLMITGAWACQACITGEKCEGQTVKSLSGKVAEFLFHYITHKSPDMQKLWICSCSWVSQITQHQHLILFRVLFSDCWKWKFCIHAKNHILSSLRQK